VAIHQIVDGPAALGDLPALAGVRGHEAWLPQPTAEIARL
jgi:hypothetical protein